MSKLEHAARLFASAGAAGVLREGAAALERSAAGQWWGRDHPALGSLLRRAGGTMRIDGCWFSTQHPQMTDGLRSRMLLGRYERPERALLRALLDPGAPVVELGGGLGVIACITNRRLTHPSNHIVVEPNVTLMPVLEKHRRWNKCSFEIVHAAISYSGADAVHLDVHRDFISARVGVDKGQEPSVPVVTLASLLTRNPVHNATLICDIEGIEVPLVEHECDVLRSAFTMLFIEIHPWTRQDYPAMFARLASSGFRMIAVRGKVHAFRQGA